MNFLRGNQFVQVRLQGFRLLGAELKLTAVLLAYLSYLFV